MVASLPTFPTEYKCNVKIQTAAPDTSSGTNAVFQNVSFPDPNFPFNANLKNTLNTVRKLHTFPF